MENKIEDWHLKHMDWEYKYLLLNSPSFKGDKNKYEKDWKDWKILDEFGSSFVDENNNFCLINDGPYDPSLSQVWAIFECPACGTRKMGIQTEPNTFHFNPIKHKGKGETCPIDIAPPELKGYFYKKIKRNLTWEEARKEKLTDYDDIFGFGIPTKNSPYGIEEEKINASEEINKFIKILDERVKIRKIKEEEEKKKDEEILLDDLKDLIDNDSKFESTKIINKFKRDYSVIKSKKGKHKECQLCGFTFKKKNGENYNEIHHIIPLSKNGKDAEINTLVLCANCHAQLHYANVDLSEFIKGIIKINGIQKKINGGE